MMRRLVVVAGLVLVASGSAAADSGRCEAEQQAVRASRAALGADHAALRVFAVELRGVQSEMPPLRRAHTVLERSVARNVARIITLTPAVVNCRDGLGEHCDKLRAQLQAVIVRMNENQGRLVANEASIAVLEARLAELAEQGGVLEAQLAADQALLEQHHAELAACQAA